MRSEMESESVDEIRDGKWKWWWDQRWKVKVGMRIEMESESEDEIRDGRWKWGGDQRGKVTIGIAKKKISFCKKDSQHKQIQLGHPTDVQLLSNWLEDVVKLFPSVIKKVPRCHYAVIAIYWAVPSWANRGTAKNMWQMMIIKKEEVAGRKRVLPEKEWLARLEAWSSQVDLACRAIYNASELNPVLHSTARSSCLITTVGWKTLFYTMYKLWAWCCAIAWQCHTIPIFCPNPNPLPWLSQLRSTLVDKYCKT